jgi:hypothetical protein
MAMVVVAIWLGAHLLARMAQDGLVEVAVAAAEGEHDAPEHGPPQRRVGAHVPPPPERTTRVWSSRKKRKRSGGGGEARGRTPADQGQDAQVLCGETRLKRPREQFTRHLVHGRSSKLATKVQFNKTKSWIC